MKLESLGGGNESGRRVTCLLLLSDMATHLQARRRRSDRTQASHLFLLQFLRESKVPTAENYASETKIGKNEGKKKERKTKNTSVICSRLFVIVKIKKKKKKKTGVGCSLK